MASSNTQTPIFPHTHTRLSATATQTSRVRRAYEQHYEKKVAAAAAESSTLRENDDADLRLVVAVQSSLSVAARIAPDANSAACVLKYFLRNLPVSLLPKGILELTSRSKCFSDETFALNVRYEERRCGCCCHIKGFTRDKSFEFKFVLINF